MHQKTFSKLTPPFSWNAQSVVVKDRVWYVPLRHENYSAFQFPGWSHHELLGNSHPVFVEYCSGNGLWIASRAQANAQTNWVAVEKKFIRVRKIWSKIKRLNLSNLIAICGHAEVATSHYFPDASVSGVFINFPDPWPKRRHEDNRLIQTAFVSELWRILKPGCSWDFVTDDVGYGDWTLQLALQHPGFESCEPAPHYVTERSDYGSSSFEQLWREQGKTIRYYRFRKKIPYGSI